MTYKSLLVQVGLYVIEATDENGVSHIITNSIKKLSQELTKMIEFGTTELKHQADELIAKIQYQQIIEVK